MTMMMIVRIISSDRFLGTITTRTCRNSSYTYYSYHSFWNNYCEPTTVQPFVLRLYYGRQQHLLRQSIDVTKPTIQHQQQRSFAAAATGKGGRRFLKIKKQKLESKSNNNNNTSVEKSNNLQQQATVSTNITSEAITTNCNNSWSRSILNKLKILLIRYRFDRNRVRQTISYYNYEQAKLIVVWRLPVFILLATVLTWDVTKPYTIISVHGPSMLPTMSPDRSDIWLGRTYPIIRFLQKYCGISWIGPTFNRGDIIGFAHPDHPNHISCKRIIGLPGDKVQRYGQYVNLFIEQDPEHLGMMLPQQSEPNSNNNNDPYDWIDRECSWDTNKGIILDRANKTINLKEVYRTIQIPDGYVWIEADCPALGIDSRQLGPIPIEWIKGKVVSKIWPFWHRSDNSLLAKKDKRPHPISLDDETLEQYNVYRIYPTKTTT